MPLHIPPLNNRSHISQVIPHMPLANHRRLDKMISKVIPSPDVKHSIQLLQRSRLGLRQTEPSEDETEQIPSRVPTESALSCEGCLKGWPRQCEDKVKSPARGCCECHAGVTDGEWLYKRQRKNVRKESSKRLTNDSAE